MSILGLFVMTCQVVLFWYAWNRFYGPFIVQPFYQKGNLLIIFIYTVLLFVFSKLYGGYKIGTLRITEIVYSQIIAIVLSNMIVYAEICLVGRNLMWAPPIFVLTVCQSSFSAIWVFLSNLVYFRLFPPRKMLLIYGTSQGDRLLKKLKTRSDKYTICEKISSEKPMEEIYSQIKKYTAIVLCDVKAGQRNKILKFCYDNSIRAYMTPKISDIIIGNSMSMHIFDTPLFLCLNKGLSVEQRFIKRSLDLILCILLLIATSPLMLITAIAIKLYDGGPVTFSQDRLTYSGKVFRLYKFRSMIVDAEKDGIARLSSVNDSRITPVGKVIRKIRFDELPQLINVLRGDMSFVGPRPERPEIASQYKKDMPEFDFRLKVKAGITGYAQVLGKYNTVPYDKLKLDLMYIESYSVILDIKLILMTLKTLLISESTEGIAENSKTALDDKFLTEKS